MKQIKFFTLILAAIGAKYYAPEVVSSTFFILTLLVYLRSKDEPFWLAFFLVLSDGFFGFLGGYEATLSAIPGLPEVQVGQFYIMLTLVKACGKSRGYPLFFSRFLIVLLVYLIFLIFQGFAIGFTPKLNVIFRLLKMTLPFFLLYSLPRLMTEEKDYRALFSYAFPLAFVILGTQVFSLIFSQSPPAYFGVEKEEIAISYAIDGNVTYRGFYNDKITLLIILGSIYFMVSRTYPFRRYYLTVVLLSIFFAVFLSATRGWILSCFLVFSLFLILVLKTSLKQIALFSVTGVLILAVLFSFPILDRQLSNSFERLMTVQRIAEGDLTAGNTLVRLTERGPRMMKKWAASPITGWAFSDYYFKYRDPHVGNQNLLFQSGVLGMLLLYGFFAYFCTKLFLTNWKLPVNHPQKGQFLVFPIFFLGWFVIHSTSGQQFGYATTVGGGMVQAILFCFAAQAYDCCRKQSLPAQTESQVLEHAYEFGLEA